MSDAYQKFLQAKVAAAPSWGFDPPTGLCSDRLLPHQTAIVPWLIAGGRRALFAKFGLGKTVMQLEAVRICAEHENGRGLIVLPLGVRQEFQRDAVEILGWPSPPQFIRSIAEAESTGVYLTNYETVRDGKLDPRDFIAVSLDEAAILRGFGGTLTFREMMATCAGDRKTLDSREITDGVKYRFVATAVPSPNDYIELLAYAAFLGIMEVSQAKAQPLDAKVLTPTGWKMMGDLSVGDEVIAGDGSATQVIGIYPQGDRPAYRVTFSDGGETTCDADHLWLTQTQYERNNENKYRRGIGRKSSARRRPSDVFSSVRQTSRIAATLRAKRNWNHSIPVAGVAEFSSRVVSIDPWLLGFLLGDGCLRETSVTVSTMDEWVLDEIRERISADGLRLRVTARGICDYGITATGRKGGNGPGSNRLLQALRSYGLLGKRAHEKSVPSDYLLNSVDVRLAILRGLMDADGTVDKSNGPTFTTTSPQLAMDVQHLVRSLGGLARIRISKTSRRDAFRVRISLPDGTNPFSLSRKANKVAKKGLRGHRRYITAVDAIGTKPMQCIAVAHPSRLYVTDDFAVTHNTRWFKRNSEKADQLTIHPHKEAEFWQWVSTWALFITKPSDLGPEYSDKGYDVPPLEVLWHEIASDHSDAGTERDGQGLLFRNVAIGVTNAAREKRDSLPARVDKLASLVAGRTDQVVTWCDLNDEQRAIEKALTGLGISFSSLYGSQSIDDREQLMMQWREGQTQAFLSKPSMYGAGVNLQQSHTMVFVGIGFRFHEIIQAVHRIHRFQQKHPCTVHFIYTEAEREVRRDFERKWSQHNEMVEKMTALIREHGLTHAAMVNTLKRSIGVERVESTGENWTMVNNDCVLESKRLPDDSIGLIVTSIPFSSQYEYSPNYSDFGHSDNNAHFFQQMDFLTPQLLRALKPGRIAAIHVKDRIVPGGMTGLGMQTVYPFHAVCIDHFVRHGFAYMGMKTIVTDVVRENNQTYRLGWSEQCKDGSKMGVGMPEYLLLFRKPPTDTSRSYGDEPVVKRKPDCIDDNGNRVPWQRGLANKGREIVGDGYSRARWQVDAHGFTRSSGNRPITAEDLSALPHDAIFQLFRDYTLTNVYDFEHHVKLGEELGVKGMLPVTFMLLQPPSWSPDVWSDVARMLTLNTAQSAKGKELHLCPLPLDIVNRAVTQWSNPGDLVLDPFAGIGSVPYCAVKLGRKAIGIELSAPYFFDACGYCKAAEREIAMPDLFAVLERENGGKAE